MEIGQFTPDVLKDTVYLHLTPKDLYNSGTLRSMNVRKAAKSADAHIEPGDVVVKLVVSVRKDFFADSMPTAEIELDAAQVIGIGVIQADAPIPDPYGDEDAEAFLAGELNG